MLDTKPLFLPTYDELVEQDFSKVVLATLLWLFLLSCFAFLQVVTNPDGKDPNVRFDYSNKLWALCDRTFLNFAEQTPLFLTVLWAHAIFCDANLAGTLGITCVVARSLYPILRSITFLLMEFSTQTYYLCSNAMIINLWSKLLYGELVTSNWTLYGLAFVYYLVPFFISLPVKILLAALSESNSENKSDKSDDKKEA